MPKPTISNTDEFMAEARRRYSYALECDQADRAPAQDDAKFILGGDHQWPAEALEFRRRASNPLPVITWNVLPVYAASVVNDGRQSKPSIHAVAGDGGDPKTAELLTDRIRQIEYESNADTVWDSMGNQQVCTGRAFGRITTVYLPKSMQQVPRIQKIDDQFSVLFDPSAKEYDRADAGYCFVTTSISKDDYRRKYGKRKDLRNISTSFFKDADNPASQWVGVGNRGDDVILAEYWTREAETKELCQLSTGICAYREDIPKGVQVEKDEDNKEITRDDDVYTVTQYIIDGVDVLEETEWLTENIPIIPQWGQEVVVEGVRYNISLIRHAKQPQQQVNYYASAIAQAVGSNNTTPWWAARGSLTNHEGLVEESNFGGLKVLYYEPLVNGQPVQPPHNALQEPPIQAMTLGLRQALDAIKSVCGIFNPSLGAPSNETSGIAIESRKKESDNANFHFHGNAARSRNYAGRILQDLLLILDKRQKKVTARKVDGTSYTVLIGQPFRDEETGETVLHDLGKGSYTIEITTGLSYTSGRQQAYETDVQLIQSVPELMNIIGDNLFRNSDAPGSEENADRMKLKIQHDTPWLIPPTGKAAQQQLPPQVQQMMDQGKQQIMLLSKTNQELQDQLSTKQLDLQSRERIAAMQEETKRLEIEMTGRIAELTAQTKGAAFQLEQTIDTIKHHLDRMDRLNAVAQQAGATPPTAPGSQQPPQPSAAPQAQPAQQEPQPAAQPEGE
jgi:hypothetical protein